MIDPEVNNLLRPIRQAGWLIWYLLTVSIWIYVAVAWAVAGQVGGGAPGLDLALTAAAVAVGIASFLMARVLQSDERLRAHLRDGSVPPIVEQAAQKAGTEDRLAALTEPQRRLLSVGSFFLTPFIVRLALHESIAIFGLVLALLSGVPGKILPFAVAATILNVLTRPNLTALLERASRLTVSLDNDGVP